jgi:hypothetical protein
MRGLLKSAAALLGLAAAPLAANSPTSDQIEVMDGVEAFFEALRSDDKTALANTLLPEGMIFVHSRMNPETPRIDVVPAADHLARWATQTRKVDEFMHIETVLVDGDMAQVWGPYYFTVEEKLSHCGINSLSMIKTDDGWKVANTSFTMEPPAACEAIVAQVNAHWEIEQ